jgi:hypothetical protein
MGTDESDTPIELEEVKSTQSVTSTPTPHQYPPTPPYPYPQPGYQVGPVVGPYGPYGQAGADDLKPWYASKAILASIASFGLYILKHVHMIDWGNDMIVQTQGFIVTLGLLFSRMGNKKIVSGATYKAAVNAQSQPPIVNSTPISTGGPTQGGTT